MMRMPVALVLILCSQFLMSQETSNPCARTSDAVVARRASHEILLNARKPDAEWQSAAPATFCADWQGRNPDPERQTEVRALWTPKTLYLRFECRYRELFVFEDSDPNGRRNHLWDRDVAEAFLQPDPSQPRYYREFEVSPNGMWIDLGIFPGGLSDLKSGLTRSVWLDEAQHKWSAELAIPMRSLTDSFDPGAIWRVNFYRVEGPKEPRFYSAWRATRTPQPDFHVPEAFGTLRFTEEVAGH